MNNNLQEDTNTQTNSTNEPIINNQPEQPVEPSVPVAPSTPVEQPVPPVQPVPTEEPKVEEQQPVQPVTPVAPTAPVTPAAPVEQPTQPVEKEVETPSQPVPPQPPKKSHRLLFTLFACIMTAIILVLAINIGNKAAKIVDPDTKGSKNNSKEEQKSNSNDNSNDNGSETVYDFDWVGTYKNGNYTVIISYDKGEKNDFVNLDVSKVDGNGYSGDEINIKDISTSKLSFDDTSMGEQLTIDVTKTSNGIHIKSTSSKTDGMFYNLDLDFTKESFAANGWNGVYKKGDAVIVLSEVSANKVRVAYGDKKLIYGSDASNTSSELKVVDSFSDEEKVTITKSSNGITVESNEIESGEYTKEK